MVNVSGDHFSLQIRIANLTNSGSMKSYKKLILWDFDLRLCWVFSDEASEIAFAIILLRCYSLLRYVYSSHSTYIFHETRSLLSCHGRIWNWRGGCLRRVPTNSFVLLSTSFGIISDQCYCPYMSLYHLFPWFGMNILCSVLLPIHIILRQDQIIFTCIFWCLHSMNQVLRSFLGIVGKLLTSSTQSLMNLI